MTTSCAGRSAKSGRAPEPAHVRWDLSDTFDDEGAGTTAPSLLTAYRALSMAVRNEERAFAFWSYVAAHARSSDIREAAETMAHEELEHVATLRRERRHAFHSQRSLAPGAGQRREAIVDVERLERRLAQRLDRWPRPPSRATPRAFATPPRGALDTAGQLASNRYRSRCRDASRREAGRSGGALGTAGGPLSRCR